MKVKIKVEVTIEMDQKLGAIVSRPLNLTFDHLTAILKVMKFHSFQYIWYWLEKLYQLIKYHFL